MPGAHRDGDTRKCGATTVVGGQSTVFVNNRLWSVDGDPNTHSAGRNKPIYGSQNVYVQNKLVICALGDTTYDIDGARHPPGQNDPLGHSMNVIVYGNAAGGGGSG